MAWSVLPEVSVGHVPELATGDIQEVALASSDVGILTRESQYEWKII